MEALTEENHLNGKVKFSAKCTQGNLSTFACNIANCKQYAFVCQDKHCPCRTVHKKCLFTCPHQILQVIQEKRNQANDVIDKVSETFDKWIDQISKARQKIEQILRNWGLSASQRKFLEILESSQYKQLTGHKIHQITSSTISYFQEQTKQKLMHQIESTSKNYDQEINYILNRCIGLFQRYQIQSKDIGFKNNEQIVINNDTGFIQAVLNYKNQNLKKIEKYSQVDYDKFFVFVKDMLKKDFSNHFQPYRQQRRAYGTKKLRQKYADDYFNTLKKGQKYVKKWQSDIQENVKMLNNNMMNELGQFSNYFHELQSLTQNPFTVDIGLQLQRTINTIFLLINLIKKRGKQLIRPLIQRNVDLSQRFNVAIYLLDELMDTHPQIDEVEMIWNVIRFDEKLKSQVDLLFRTIEEALKAPIIVQVITEQVV